MIMIDGLTFDYEERRAVDNVSVSLPRCSITALVGPNGAGKTTLMRCLAALSRPFSGRVLIDGLDIHADPRRAHLLIGYLPDTFGLYETLTIRQCLLYRAAAQGVEKAKRGDRAAAAAEMAGLNDRMDEKVGSLSRGMRQRLGIAQAVIHQPKVLILDEPASGLDPGARSSLSLMLRGLRGQGTTILVSSHILSELEDYSSHILVMREGKAAEFRQIDGGGAPLMTDGGGAPLMTDGGGAPLITMVVELADAAESHAEKLKLIPGIRRLESVGPRHRIELPSAPESRAATLRAMIEAGLPVIGLSPERGRLQDIYLAGGGDES